MQNSDKLSDISDPSLANISTEITKSFLEKIDPNPEDNSEVRRTNINHLLKNIRNNIQAVPNSLDQNSLSKIIEILSETFKVTSSTEMHYKICEILFLIEKKLSKPLKKTYKEHLNLMLDLSRHKEFFASLLSCIGNYYKKIANDEHVDKKHVNEDFGIEFYEFSIEVLSITCENKYQECSDFLLSNTKLVKSIFFTYFQIEIKLYSSKKILKIFERVLDLLNKFSKVEEINSFSSLFIISMLSEIQEHWNMHLRVSEIIVMFLTKNLTKTNYYQLLCIDIIFSPPLIVSLYNEGHQEKWFKLWEIVYRTIPERELSDMLSQKFNKVSNYLYQQGITIFLKKCETDFNNVLVVLEKALYLEKLLNKLVENSDNAKFTEYLLDSIEILMASSCKDDKTFKLILDEKILKIEICQKRLKKFIQITLAKKSDLKDFYQFLLNIKSFQIAVFFLSCFADNSFKEITEKFLENRNIDILTRLLLYDYENFRSEDLYQIWKNFFTIFYLIDDKKKKFTFKIANSVITELRKDKYNENRTMIIENCVEILQDIISKKLNNSFLLISFDFSAYISGTQRFQHFQDYVLRHFKLSKIRYNRVDIIISTILYHLKFKNLDESYFDKLKKCIEYNISPKNIIELFQLIINGSQLIKEKTLTVISHMLKSQKRSMKFWYFNGTAPERFSFTENVKTNNEISLFLRLYQNKISSDSTILEFQDESNFFLSLKISDFNVQLKIKQSEKEILLNSEIRLKKKDFNFITVSILGGKNPALIFQINTESICYPLADIKFSSRTKVISIGGTLNKTENFRGKISSVMILKKFCSSEVIMQISDSFYFKITDELKNLKDKVLFKFSAKHKSGGYKRLDEERGSYYFKGKKLEKVIKYGICSLHEILQKENNEQISIILLEILGLLKNSKEISIKSFLKVLALRLDPRSFEYSKFIELVLSIKNEKLQKEITQQLLVQDTNYSPVPLSQLENFLTVYKFSFNFTANNFLLLISIAKHLNDSEIYDYFRVFSGDLKHCDITAEILATLAQMKKYGMINNLLKILTDIQITENIENLFKVLMHFLKFPNYCDKFAYIFVIIFNYYLKPESTRSSFGKDSTRNKVMELNKYLTYINDNLISDIAPLLEAVVYITPKGIRFQDKSNIRSLFDIILHHAGSMEDESLTLFNELLHYFNKNFNSAIIKSPHYPKCFIKLFNKFDSKIGEIIIYIYSEITKFKSFEKLVELFRGIKDLPNSFSYFASLFNKLYEKLSEHSNLFAELMIILSMFTINKENSEAYCEIVRKFSEILKKNPVIFKFSYIGFESEKTLCEKYIGIIFINIAFQTFSSNQEVLIDCKNLMNHPEVDFFTKLKLDKIDEDYCILFVFLKVSNLISQHSDLSKSFLEELREKTHLLERIEGFIRSLSDEKLNGCNVPLQDAVSLRTNSLAYLSSIKSGNLSDTILTEEWKKTVNLLLTTFILDPFDILLSCAKENQLKPPIIKKSRGGSVDCSSILMTHGKLDSFNLAVEFIKARGATWCKSQEYTQRNYKNNICYKRINFQDTSCRASRISLRKFVVETEQETRKRLYKNSIIRTKSVIDYSSMLGTDVSGFTDPRQMMDSIIKTDYFSQEFEQITISGSYYGKLVINIDYIQMKFDNMIKPFKLTSGALEFTARSKQSLKLFNICDISEVVTRKFIHLNTAFEIFLKSGKSYLINLFSDKKRSEALNIMKKWKSVSIVEDPCDIISSFKKKWQDGSLSNFQYLLIINKYAGRSFHDISQYPVFPWTYTNFQSPDFDLSNPSNFRNFDYPITAQTEKQRKEISFKSNTRSSSIIEDYQNGSHYSNGGIVLYYLFRIEPFTQQAKILHDGSLDHPNRAFFSFKSSWESCLNIGDSKECIPELFYLPEIFSNLNEIEVGENSMKIDSSVFLQPPWASNYWDLVRKLRKSLESPHCSKMLQKWIDLIFGYKQRGKTAKENYNLYMRVTYDDIFEKGSSSILENIEGIRDQIYHFGQTPRQIFFQPHAKRKLNTSVDIFEKIDNKIELSEVKISIGDRVEVKGILINEEYFIVFYLNKSDVNFFRYKITKKIKEKRKIYSLIGVKWVDENNMKFLSWANWIVTYGHQNYKIKLHDFSGEFKAIIDTQIIRPSAVFCRSNLYCADFNIIVAINSSLKTVKKFYGHSEEVVSINASESYSLIASLSENGTLVVHDMKTIEILLKILTNFLYIQISEYGTITGVCGKGYSLLSFQGKVIYKKDVLFEDSFIMNKTGEYLVYREGSCFTIIDVFENKEKIVRQHFVSLLSLNESNKHLVGYVKESNYLLLLL